MLKIITMFSLILFIIISCNKNDNSSNPSNQSITITVKSKNPSSGVPIEVSPTDINGNSDGKTSFTRTYTKGTSVYLTAPETYGGKDFKYWNRDNGEYYEYSTEYGIGTDKNHSVVAEYSTSVSTKILYIQSSPNNGVNITVSITDNNGLKNGTTPFNRTFNQGTTLTLTAPSNYDGKTFYRWNRDDGAYYHNSTSYGIGMDTDHSVIVEYR